MKKLIFAFTCLFLTISCQARIITVDDDKAADFNNIQAAIDYSNDGDIIEVQPGTYIGPGNRDINFDGKTITVRGNDPNNPAVVAATIIDCGGSISEPHRGFYFYRSSVGPDSVVAGLTITNGYQSKGGGIYCYDYSSPKISHCRIVGNSASFRGGGICSDMSNMIIENCTIIGNSVNNPNYIGAGGGIYCGGGGRGYPMIINCLITNNSAAGSAVVDKDVGGGIYLTAEHATIRNCTIVRNSAEYCGGIGINQYRTATINNCILWDNSDSYISGNPTVSYSDVQGGFLGTGNINADPLFVNPATVDFHLSEASPCRDSGDPLYIRTSGETDIDGEPRVMGICVDMGADEFTDEVLAMPIIEISSTEFVFSSYEGGPNPDAQILSIRNVGLGTLYWRIIKDCSWLEVVPIHGESTGDVNEVTLSVDISGLNWGSYTCELMIIPDRAANGPQTITVNLYIIRELPLEVPSEYGTIQAAIDATVPGDTVVVTQGTYNENINLNGKNIILTSTNPNDPAVVAGTVIQGDGTTSVVTFSGSEDKSCQLTGFTIRGGNTNDPQHGGGIRGNSMTAKISNCHITGNSAYRRGGGLFDCDGPITSCTISGNTVTSPATTEGAGLHSCDGPISDCTINNNSSGSITQSGFGGGLYSCHGPITNCTITGNSAGGNGGGLYNCDGPISNCTIVGNTAQNYMFQCRGGGLSHCDGAISNCIISDNVAGESGGGLNRCRGVISNCRINGNTAIDWEGGGLRQCHGSIINCTIIGNSTSRSGGGLSWCKSIRNCIISSNRAGENGGGLYDCTGPINCTISGNIANGNGGGIYYREPGTTVANCILWDNRATKGNEIYLDFYIVCGQGGCLYIPSSMSVRYSNVQGGETAAYIEPECTLNWELGNIDADPCFASPGYWDPNGTPDDPSDDFWVDGDYHLKSQAGRWDANSQSWVKDDVTSPCIDAGNPGCPEANEPAPNGNRRNMGAYGGTAEASKSPAKWRSIADLTNDWVVDSNDLKVFVGYWLQKGECIPSDLNRSLFVDFNDFAIFGLQWSYPSASEPRIFYQVEDCNMEGGQNQPSATDSNDTRFSVWVEGNYIHFKDLITANCCLDEIELQMTVEDGLITIFEIEHLTTPCFCICDYPTTATLGPFEPGIYLLEVIDIDGKSLGIVEVTIGEATEPGITYQIEDCNLQASVSFTAEPPEQTRFTVTVEGLYIHFKDRMRANCCPDKLELEMTVEDNLITIYEIEYLLGGCRCLCSFPITATLGPFEPGNYVLEVYQNYGGFIGSTTVVIDPPG